MEFEQLMKNTRGLAHAVLINSDYGKNMGAVINNFSHLLLCLLIFQVQCIVFKMWDTVKGNRKKLTYVTSKAQFYKMIVEVIEKLTKCSFLIMCTYARLDTDNDFIQLSQNDKKLEWFNKYFQTTMKVKVQSKIHYHIPCKKKSS